jgi:hypothetical protein
MVLLPWHGSALLLTIRLNGSKAFQAPSGLFLW